MASTKETFVVDSSVSGPAKAQLQELEKIVDRIAQKLSTLNAGNAVNAIARKEGSAGVAAFHTAQGDAAIASAALQHASRVSSTADNAAAWAAANAASPGTTPESRKDAASVRSTSAAEAAATRAAASVVSTQAAAAFEKSVAGPRSKREAAAYFQKFGRTTIPQWHAKRVALQRQQDEDREAARASRASDFADMTNLQDVRFLGRIKNTADLNEVYQQRDTNRQATFQGRTKDIGDRNTQRAEALSASRAASKAHIGEMADATIQANEKKAAHKRLMRSQLKAASVTEKTAEELQQQSQGQLRSLVSMLPGGRMLNGLRGMMPGVSGKMAQVAGWGSQSIEGLQVSGMGASLGSWGMGGAGIAGIGAVAGAGVLGAAGGVVVAGEYGVNQLRDRFAPSVGRLRNVASTLRHAPGMGGVGTNAAFMRSGLHDRMAARGIGSAAIAGSYAGFLSGRGEANGDGNAVNAGFAGAEEALSWGIEGNQIGRMAAAGGYGHAGGLAGAGLRGDALQEHYGALLGLAEGSKAHGMQYDTSGYTSMARSMSADPTFGGGRYGGALATQRFAGAGNGLANQMRGSMSSMADMAVMSQAASEGGDYMDIIERTENMSPRDKEKAIVKMLGADGARYAKFSLGESKKRAGTRPGSKDPGAAAPIFYDDTYGALTGKTEVALDRMAADKGSAAERIAGMDAETDKNLATIAANLTLLNGYLDARKATMGATQRFWSSWADGPGGN